MMDDMIQDQSNKVMIRVDDDSFIIEINSDAFVSDTSGWIEIDSGTGDRYHHAQNHYLPRPLTDDRGIFQYKLCDGEIVERTAEEMDADYAARPKPEPTNEELLLEMAADHEYRICLMELGVTENDL